MLLPHPIPDAELLRRDEAFQAGYADVFDDRLCLDGYTSSALQRWYLAGKRLAVMTVEAEQSEALQQAASL